MTMKMVYMKAAVIILVTACVLLALTLAKTLVNFHGFGEKVAEKTEIIRENEQKYKENLDSLTSTINDMNARFKIVTVSEALNSMAGFEQPVSAEDKLRIDKLFTPSDKSLKNLLKTFDEYRAKIETPNVLSVSPETLLAVDRDTSVLLELCKRAGLKAETTLYWDLKGLKRWTETKISGEQKVAKNITKIVCGTSGILENAVVQSNASTIVFPFKLSIMNSKPQQPYAGLELPVGTYYAHYYQVFSKGPWILEYDTGKTALAEDLNLRALCLDNSARITSSLDGALQTFEISPRENESTFLVVSDRTFIPSGISARLKTP